MDIVVFTTATTSPVVFLILAVKFFQTQSARRWPKWLTLVVGNGLVLGFLLAAAFLVLETRYRFFYDTTDSYANTRTSSRWFYRHYFPNDAGFRDSIQYHLTPRRGLRRVSFVGDSFTAGHGIKNVEDRFANLIRRRRPKWETHALAKSGCDTGAHLDIIKQAGADGYRFDVIVLVYGLNDIADLIPETGAILATLADALESRNPFVRNSYFLDTLHFRLQLRRHPEAREYFHFVRAAYEGDIWEQQEERLRALKQAASEANAPLLVVTFPFLHQLGPDYPFRDLHSQLRQFWEAEEVPYLDLLETLEGRSADELVVNRFDAHPNETAHSLAADAIEAFLAANIQAPAAPPTDAAP